MEEYYEIPGLKPVKIDFGTRDEEKTKECKLCEEKTRETFLKLTSARRIISALEHNLQQPKSKNKPRWTYKDIMRILKIMTSMDFIFVNDMLNGRLEFEIKDNEVYILIFNELGERIEKHKVGE